MYVITGNYGDDSIALLQWVIDKQLPDVYFVSVDTGFAAPSWLARVAAGEAYARRHGVQPIRLKALSSFADETQARREFPNKKFQWCAAFLKGLALLDWLDGQDPACQATILLGKRRAAARANQRLAEWERGSALHGERDLWYPLYLLSSLDHQALIAKSDFAVCGHRSLECDPCIHNTHADFLRMDDEAIARLSALESAVGQPMFDPEAYGGARNIAELIAWVATHSNAQAENHYDHFSMGCGSPWGCGE